MRVPRSLVRAAAQAHNHSLRRTFATTSQRCRAFRDGDVALLKDKKNHNHEGILVKLQASKTLSSHRGDIKHADVIGKEPRQLVQSSRGNAYRIHEPTLAEYVRLTPRIVTPIYPSDANLIVSLLDIHVERPTGFPDETPPMEIFEAGTGHGALTLHLARAIHAGNPALPKLPSYTTTEQEVEDPVYLGESIADLQSSSMDSWRASRRAIVHTLDRSSKHSKHARKIVAGFKNGLYAGNVDFYVGDVTQWILDQQAARKTDDPFLSRVILDLPNAENHLETVASALQVNGILAVFNPNITQIAECVEKIQKERMPYLLDQVIELGASTIREWDIRLVKPRKTTMKAEEKPEEEDSAESSGVAESSGEQAIDPVKGQEIRDDEMAQDFAAKNEEKMAMVCRPKAGAHVVGGGFVAHWRRMEKPDLPEAA